MFSKKKIIDNVIEVVKDFPSLKEQSDFWYHANNSEYCYGQKSDSLMPNRQGRMAHHFDPEQFIQTSFWKRVEKQFKEPLGLSEAYINMADSATLNYPHCDNRENHMSILLCLNQDWHRNWGGYTSFFEGMHGNEVISTVVPEPGKAVFFNGSIYHTAMPPNITATYPRFMLALKTFWQEEKSDEKNK